MDGFIPFPPKFMWCNRRGARYTGCIPHPETRRYMERARQRPFHLRVWRVWSPPEGLLSLKIDSLPHIAAAEMSRFTSVSRWGPIQLPVPLWVKLKSCITLEMTCDLFKLECTLRKKRRKKKKKESKRKKNKVQQKTLACLPSVLPRTDLKLPMWYCYPHHEFPVARPSAGKYSAVSLQWSLLGKSSQLSSLNRGHGTEIEILRRTLKSYLKCMLLKITV